jgi:hypothetical protein
VKVNIALNRTSDAKSSSLAGRPLLPLNSWSLDQPNLGKRSMFCLPGFSSPMPDANALAGWIIIL